MRYPHVVLSEAGYRQVILIFFRFLMLPIEFRNFINKDVVIHLSNGQDSSKFKMKVSLAHKSVIEYGENSKQALNYLKSL